MGRGGQRRSSFAVQDLTMLTEIQVRRFAHESGIKDLQVVEKEIVLTYLLQLLAEKGFLKEVAFKGGTCIRKTWFGAKGRFSTGLDFTCIAAGKSADDFVLQLHELMMAPFHDIQFNLDLGDGWYETGDGVSWGCEPHYKHTWGEGTIKLQVSNREVPTLTPNDRAQLEISYFKLLPFRPSAIPCLRIEEILAEKIRATYQREKPRDIWDLDQFADRPMPDALIRKLVVTKLWQVSDAFVPDKWFEKLKQAAKWDWDDLRQLVRGGSPDPKLMLERCTKRFAFLSQLDADEAALAADPHQRQSVVHKRSIEACNRLAQEHRLK